MHSFHMYVNVSLGSSTMVAHIAEQDRKLEELSKLVTEQNNQAEELREYSAEQDRKLEKQTKNMRETAAELEENG